MFKSKFSLSIIILSLALMAFLSACGAAAPETDTTAAQPEAIEAPEGSCEGDAAGLASDCAAGEGSAVSLNLEEKEIPAALELPRDVDVATAKDIYQRDDVVLIDVRETWEYEAAHIPDTTLLPMSELQTRLSEIPTDKTVLISCNSGNRSNQVTAFLTQQGYTNVHNVLGGIQAWQAAGYPVNRN